MRGQWVIVGTVRLRRHNGRSSAEPASPPATSGRVPRVARLLALAIHFDRLLATRVVKDYAELARLGHVSRARISQIMGLLNLAPDLQEQVLFLPHTPRGRDRIQMSDLLPIASILDWPTQRRRWRERIATMETDR